MVWVIVLVVATAAFTADEVQPILPAGIEYDDGAPMPEAILGQPIGRWHLRHDQLLAYLEHLAASSPRLTLLEQGVTHEGRRLVLLVASSEANLGRLDEILERRRQLHDPQLPMPPADELEGLPVVIYLGYSIHGNEASGSNASALVAYHLAAAKSAEVSEWLDRSVVLIDPSLNPDGMDRFAVWVNMHRGERVVPDENHREHRESWPNGRTNHYWFDLNRDWLLLQHPESRARVETLHRWHPDLIGDFHEMGSDSTYFFQPGVPERENPLKPQENIELTRALAAYHARALGQAGQLFYSEETFDDYYPGKGSTYPDLIGAVGVLFEQASARGHAQETENGLLTFQRAIANHLLTSLSMLEGGAALKTDLVNYQAGFRRRALEEATRDRRAGFVFSCPLDRARCGRMIEVLLGHRLRVERLTIELEVEGRTYDPAWSWFVPIDQVQYRLVRSLFETPTEFPDSTFYDVSTWTLPLAFGAAFDAVERQAMPNGARGDAFTEPIDLGGRFEAEPAAYAYLFDWSSYFAPRALRRLLDAGFDARVTARALTVETPDGRRDLALGAIVAPLGDGARRAELEELLAAAAAEDGVAIWATRSGLTPDGVDLGSPRVHPLVAPRLALVVGRGVSTYEAGEMWHLLDRRFGFAVTLLERDLLDPVDLGTYTHLLMVDGSYDGISEDTQGRVARWVEKGGVLVATKAAAVWAQGLFENDGMQEDTSDGAAAEPAAEGGVAAESPPVPRRPYADYQRDRAAELVSGVVVGVELDLTHPLAFGYRAADLPVFRNSTASLSRPADPYSIVAAYAEEPWVSGYLSESRRSELGGATALVASRHGEGTVILMADNPNFRAIWYGTSKLLLNAVFFAQVVRSTSPPSDW